MAEKVRYNNILESGRADETLTYTKYVKDESSGKSTQEMLDEKVNKTDKIETAQIADKAVTTEKLNDSAVTEGKLADGSVTTPKVADENITTQKLAPSSVTTEKINDKAVTTEKLADQSVDNSKLSPSSVTYDKIKDKSVITEKLNDRAVTTEKVEEKAITNPKLGDQSVDSRVLREANVETKHLANESVTAEKIKSGTITKEKIADNTMTIEKLDPELRKAVEAATGLPDDMVEMIQDIDQNLAKLNDTVYPITLGLTVNPDLSKMQTEVKYSVTSDGKSFVPERLSLTKSVNNEEQKFISDVPSASGSFISPLQGNREIFALMVTYTGRTPKSTNTTRYLCYYGGNSASSMTAEILNSLDKVSTTGVSFNPKVTTKDNDYIWLVVPSYLTISRVTSAGFDVTLATPQTITNSLGSFKAYRTINPLTAETWDLVIS